MKSSQLGDNLKLMRKVLGLDQAEFAQFLTKQGIKTTRGMIVTYETKNNVPKLEWLLKLARATSINMQDLLEKHLHVDNFSEAPKNLDTMNEALQLNEPRPPYADGKKIDRMMRTIEQLTETITQLSKLVNDVPALRGEVERLKKEVEALKQRGQ